MGFNSGFKGLSLKSWNLRNASRIWFTLNRPVEHKTFPVTIACWCQNYVGVSTASLPPDLFIQLMIRFPPHSPLHPPVTYEC